MRSRRFLWALCLFLLLGATTVSAASSGGGGPGPGKPPRPEHDHPTKHGLVSALGAQAAVSTPTVGSAAARVFGGSGIPGAAGATTLVLYDTTSEYGWLGELYAIATANVVSHFGSWRAEPVASYRAGEMLSYTAVVYVGSTYDEPIPTAFLDDVWSGARPVVWVYDNIWELTNRYSATWVSRYGWSWWQYDTSPVARVDYRGVALTRDPDNDAGIMKYSFVDATKAQVLATAVRSGGGGSFPWAIWSANLTYVGEIPFAYTGERDRLLAFEDLLFDVLQPTASQRHRALVRLEDVDPHSDPAVFKAAVDYLYAAGVPFGFGVIPVFTDPLAVENPKSTTIELAGSKIAPLVTYALAHGGTLVEHGLTHQYSNVRNPYNGLTGDDFEFYRVVEQSDHSLDYQGPLAGDSTTWALGRFDVASQKLAAAGAPQPSIFEFPHYTASAVDYAAALQRFGVRWERALYFGHLADGSADPGRVIGQLFPFVVRDVYGSLVLPENIGDYEPEAFYTFPAHTVADMLAAADANKVVRDGFASFYYYTPNGVDPLRQTVEGLRARGWTFVDPSELAGVPRPSAPVSTAPPTISGSAVVGQTLTASPGTWSGNPTFSYQWLRCDAAGGSCAPVRKATSTAYQLQRADAGDTVRVQVTATNAIGSATATSAASAVVARR